MMRLAETAALRLLATFAVAALVLLGSVHHHGPKPDASLSAFLQAGGSLADICQAGADKPHPAASECPACTLAKSIAIGPVVAVLIAQRLPMGSVQPGRAEICGVTRGPRPPPARGPPVIA